MASREARDKAGEAKSRLKQYQLGWLRVKSGSIAGSGGKGGFPLVSIAQVPETAVLLRSVSVRLRSRKARARKERDCIQRLSAMPICPGELMFRLTAGCGDCDM